MSSLAPADEAAHGAYRHLPQVSQVTVTRMTNVGYERDDLLVDFGLVIAAARVRGPTAGIHRIKQTGAVVVHALDAHRSAVFEVAQFGIQHALFACGVAESYVKK